MKKREFGFSKHYLNNTLSSSPIYSIPIVVKIHTIALNISSSLIYYIELKREITNFSVVTSLKSDLKKILTRRTYPSPSIWFGSVYIMY